MAEPIEDQMLRDSLGRVDFGFQSLGIADGYAAAINPNHSFRLQPGKVAGNELAHRSNLRSQFLITGGQCNLHALSRGPAFLMGETQEKRGEPVTYRRKGKFLNDSYQPSQASPDHAQHFERDFRMSQAKRLEILLADEEERGILDCRH